MSNLSTGITARIVFVGLVPAAGYNGYGSDRREEIEVVVYHVLEMIFAFTVDSTCK